MSVPLVAVVTRTVPKGWTTICVDLLTPGAVAEIVAVPGASDLTSPEAETTASVGSLVDQVVGLKTRWPAASQSFSTSCTESPTGNVSRPGVRVLVATGLARTALQVPPRTVQPTVPLRWAGGGPATAAMYEHEAGFPTRKVIVSDPNRTAL